VASTKLWSSPIGKIRVLGRWEAASFLLLVGLGMPLKYMAEQPLGVRILGPIHGLLFLWLMMETVSVTSAKKLTLPRAFSIFVASLLPFGPFLLEPHLKKWGEEADAKLPD
jgi:integral membrane protein